MGWAGFLPIVPWIQAFIWAFRPTDVVAGSGEGQLPPSGILPKFDPPSIPSPQGRFAVRITLEDQDQSKFPIGAQGAAQSTRAAAALLLCAGSASARIRGWLYPIPFLKRRRLGADLFPVMNAIAPIIAAPVRAREAGWAPWGSLHIATLARTSLFPSYGLPRKLRVLQRA